MALGFSTTTTQQDTKQDQPDTADATQRIGHLGQLGTLDLPTAEQSQKYTSDYNAQRDEDGSKVNTVEKIALLAVGGVGIQTQIEGQKEAAEDGRYGSHGDGEAEIGVEDGDPKVGEGSAR